MLTVTLVATFASAALWQQFRSIEVETSERGRVQSGWLLIGALDWARLILREDARAGGVDYLAEPWAVPLKEARLSSFLAVDKNAIDTEQEGEAFLSGQVSDLQARLNVANLITGTTLSEPGMVSFGRLFELLGLPAQQLTLLSSQLLLASQSKGQTGSPLAPLMPQRVDQLVWLGISPQVLAALSPFITLLPQPTSVNLNTASAEVIYACTPGLDLSTAQKVVAARERSHFKSLADANQQIKGPTAQFDQLRHSVGSQFFEVLGSLRLDQTTVQERSVLQREGLNVRTIARERGVITDFPAATATRP